MVTSVTQADYRGRGSNDLIICTKNGDGKCLCLDLNNFGSKWLILFAVKGYERSKINLQSIKRPDDGQLSALMTIKKNLLLELSQYAANTKVNKDNLESEDTKFIPEDEVGVIPASTRLQIAIATNTVDPSNVSWITHSMSVIFKYIVTGHSETDAYRTERLHEQRDDHKGADRIFRGNFRWRNVDRLLEYEANIAHCSAISNAQDHRVRYSFEGNPSWLCVHLLRPTQLIYSRFSLDLSTVTSSTCSN